MVALQNHAGGYVPNLSIKNVPEPMVARLRARAKQHYRSLQGELMAILEEAVQPRKLSLEEVRQRVQELGIQTGDESTAWVRELRDAR
jgi:plasmid stability protein